MLCNWDSIYTEKLSIGQAFGVNQLQVLFDHISGNVMPLSRWRIICLRLLIGIVVPVILYSVSFTVINQLNINVLLAAVFSFENKTI